MSRRASLLCMVGLHPTVIVGRGIFHDGATCAHCGKISPRFAFRHTELAALTKAQNDALRMVDEARH